MSTKSMKVLVLANEKGGVGKSMFVSQYAYYCAEKLGLKTLVIDLDHQANSSKALVSSERCHIANVLASQVLADAKTLDMHEPFVLIKADDGLTRLEKNGDKHGFYAGNLATVLESASVYYDICIIDTNPNPDIRQITAIVVASHVLSPIQLNQEAIDGIGRLFENIKKLKQINKKMVFLGLMPNLVEATPFQRNNLAELVKHFSTVLFKTDAGKVAFIPTRTALAEAQAAGLPVWAMQKTSARTAWSELKPIFEIVSKRLEFDSATQ